MERALDGVRPLFRAIVTTAVPEARELMPESWTQLEVIVDKALSERAPAVRRQVRAFMRLLNVMSLLRHGHGFVRLDASRRHQLLERLSSSRLLLMRRGVWGVRTLAFMGYYARPEAAREIGYRAHPRGWLARAGATGSAHSTEASANP